MTTGKAKIRKCRRYATDYIDSYLKPSNKSLDEKPTVIIDATLARQERKKKAKADRAAQLAAERGEPIVASDVVAADSVVFEADGYKHIYCPVSDIVDMDLMGIMTDTLFCIDTKTNPNEGAALDQSYMFRVAFTVLSREREAIKNETEKKAIEDSKKKTQSNKKR